MTSSTCFSYSGSASSGTRGPTNTACFSYSAEAPSSQRDGRTNSTCFSSLTSTTCFRY